MKGKYYSWVSFLLTFSILFSIAIVALPVSNVIAAVSLEEVGDIISENFDEYPTGNKPNSIGWNYGESKGTISIDETPDASDKSVKIQRTETDTAGNLWARKTFNSALTGTYAIRVKAMASQTNAVAYIMNVRKNSSTELANIMFSNNGNISYQLSSGSAQSLQTYSKDTWYDIVTVVDTVAKKYSVFIDGVKKIGSIDFKNIASDTLNYVEFQVYRSNLGTVYYNDFNVYTCNLSLNKADTTITIGESETLSATALPDLNGIKNITWSSQDTGIAIVDEKGQVTAVGSGTTVITAVSGSGASAQCTVTVPEAPHFPVEGISLDSSALNLYTGESKVVLAQLNPIYATDKGVTWESSQPSVVSVVYDVYSGAATLMGLLPGNGIVTATSSDGGFTDSCMVTVKEGGDVFVEDFDNVSTGAFPETLDPLSSIASYTASVEELPSSEDKSLKIQRDATNTASSFYVKKTILGDQSRAVISFKAMASQTNEICILSMLIGPASAGITQLSFFNDGKIKAYVGNSWTAASSELQNYTAGRWYDFKLVMDSSTQKFDVYIDGVMKGRQLPLNSNAVLKQVQFGIYKGAPATMYINDLNIYSYKPISGVNMSQTSMNLAVNSSETLSVNLQPASALFLNIQWNSRNADIAAVDENGVVTALKEGNTTITAVVTDTVSSAEYTVSCDVGVYFQHVSEINLDQEQIQLPVNSARKLQAIVLPQNASNKTITWTSTDPNIATVDENGNIAALSTGTSIVKAIAIDGNVEALCTVNVINRQIQSSYYVSPGGDDNNAGTEELPFKTLERARNEVRNINRNMNGDIVIYLKAGTYTLEQTFLLNESDSGSNGYNIIYRAYQNEKPVLSGGKEITQWSVYDSTKNIYRAPSQNVQTRQLYVNGVRAIRARSAGGMAEVLKTSTGFTTTDTFLADYQRISDLELVFHEMWTQPRCGVDTITLANGVADIKMKQPGWSAVTNKGGTSVKTGPVYYENAYELLDKEGEWYLDTLDGYFYYIPRKIENMNEVKVIAPVLEELVNIEGSTLDTPIQNILFEGITFSYNTWMWPSTPHGLPDAQNNHLRYSGQDDKLITAAVNVKRANHINFIDCVFSKLGSTGLKMIGGVQDSVIQGNKFYDISGSAANVGEPTNNNPNIYNPQDSRLVMRNIKVINNYIHDIGVEYASAAAVSGGFPVDSVLSYNQIFNIPYSAFHVGYGWTNYDTSVLKNTKIENNYIHDLMGAGIYDGGGIYTLGRTSGTMENPNLVSGNYIQNQMDKYAALYADDGNNYWSFKNNVIDLSETPVWEGMDACWAMGKTKHLVFDNNYTTTAKYMSSSAEPFTMTNTHVYQDANWPQEALDIITNSGLMQEYYWLADGSLERASLPKTVELNANDTYELNVVSTKNKGQAADISTATIWYNSDNESVAAVDNQGVISALGTGIAVIETNIFMGEVIRTLKTTVYVNDMLETIEFKNAPGDFRRVTRDVPFSLGAYGKTMLGHEIALENISYVSSNPEMVSIDSNGVVTGKLEGIANVIVSCTYKGVTVNRSIQIEVILYSSDDGLYQEAYHINNELKDVDNWHAYGTNGSVSSSDNGIVLSTPNNLGTFEGRKFENELLTFHMDIQSDAGWEAIQFRNQTKDKQLDTTYAVVIKPDAIELHRFNNGQRTVIFGNVTGFTSIGGDAYANDIFPFRTNKLIQLGAINEENGVRIILNIDGKNIFYFLDKDENRIEAPGYFSMYARWGSVALNKAPKAALASDTEVIAGETLSVTGSVYLEQSLELKQVTLKYDSQMFDYEGLETLIDNIIVTDVDTLEDGIIKLYFSGPKLTKEEINEVFRLSFKAKKAGESDICLQNAILSENGQNNLKAAAVKKEIVILPKPDGNTNPDETDPDPDSSNDTANPVTGDNPSEETSVIKLDPVLNSSTADAKVILDEETLESMFNQIEQNTAGIKIAIVDISSVHGADSYTLELPASALAKAKGRQLEVITEWAKVKLSGNVLNNVNISDEEKVNFTIIKADTSGISKQLQKQIDNKPVIEFHMTANNKEIKYNNSDVPVTISIFYKPTIDELKNPENLVVWYLDEDGKVLPIPSGRYISSIGAVEFTTTHFSLYAIAQVFKTFEDLDKVEWAKNKIEILASKGIISGTSDRTFNPSSSITRANFVTLLVKTLGLSASIDTNFKDVSKADYYYESVGIVKKLGLVDGVGDNRFNPQAYISRQDMIVITAKALNLTGKLDTTTTRANLEVYIDKSEIADYALDYMAALVKEELIVGDGDRIRPLKNTTRAEAAVLLYKIYTRSI